MQKKRPKLTPEERRKRQARNERRGRKSERKSEEPRKASARTLVGPPGLGRAVRGTPAGKRAILATVKHAQKWRETPPCDCARCVARRALEAEFKTGKQRAHAEAKFVAE